MEKLFIGTQSFLSPTSEFNISVLNNFLSFSFSLARISLVNSAIVAYFIQDLQINKHFDLFKKLLFMEDGEFSLSLSNQLFEKVLFFLFSFR